MFPDVETRWSTLVIASVTYLLQSSCFSKLWRLGHPTRHGLFGIGRPQYLSDSVSIFFYAA